MRRQLFASAAACAAVLLAGTASAQAQTAPQTAVQTYGRLVVFGDSLTDNGNLFAVSRGTNPLSPPYFQGRFSNGPTFVELLGFGPLNGFGNVNGSTDFAFGGARTDLSQSPPGMRLQLASYLGAGGQFGAGDLVVVYGGANNIFQGIDALRTAGAAANANPAAYITAITNTGAADVGVIINGVAAAGGGTVLVPNLPSLGATPQFNGFIPNLPAGTRDLAEGATMFFNAALLGQVNAASVANAGTNFIYMDVNRADAFIRANPAAFGYTDVTTPCLNLITNVPCANPDQRLYWDSVHPTAAGHRSLALLTQDYLYYGARGAAAAAVGETSLAHREQAQDAVLQALESGPEGEGLRFNAAVDGGSTEDSARGNVPDVERDTTAVRFGFDGRIRPDVVVGLMVHGARSEVDAGALQFDADSLGADAYVGLTFGAGFANLVVGGSTDEYGDYRRVTGVGPITHAADRFTGSSLGAKAQGGYRFVVGNAVAISPRAALAAISTQVDAFSENGASARHAQREQDLDAVLGEASVRVGSPFAGDRFAGWIEAGYGDFLSYDGDVATALVDNPARPLTSEIDELGRGALLKLGADGEIVPGLRLGLSYSGRYSDEHDSRQARLTVTYRPGS